AGGRRPLRVGSPGGCLGYGRRGDGASVRAGSRPEPPGARPRVRLGRHAAGGAEAGSDSGKAVGSCSAATRGADRVGGQRNFSSPSHHPLMFPAYKVEVYGREPGGRDGTGHRVANGGGSRGV